MILRLRTLTQTGFAHYIVPIVVVVLFATIGAAYLSLTHADSLSCTESQYSVSINNNSKCVQYVQQMLNGVYARVEGVGNEGRPYTGGAFLTADSQFGSLTQAQVKTFQGWASVNASGVVDANTWTQLCEYAVNGETGAQRTGSTQFDSYMRTGVSAGLDAGCSSSAKPSSGGTPTPTPIPVPTPTPSPVTTPKGPTKLISLGGSIAAGAGLDPYGVNTLTGCPSESSASFPAIMAKDLDLQLVQAACSGATAANILPGNLSGHKVQADTKATEMDLVPATEVKGNIVTLFVGGNDSGWIEDIGDCFSHSTQNGYPMTSDGVAWPMGCPTDATQTADFENSLPTLQTNIKTIVSTLKNEGAADVVVDEYYAVAATESDISCIPTNTAAHYHVPAQNPGINWLQARLPELNRAIYNGAVAGGAKVVVPNFSGHYMCASDPWVAGPGLNDGATAHPTYDGQKYLAKLNEAAL